MKLTAVPNVAFIKDFKSWDLMCGASKEGEVHWRARNNPDGAESGWFVDLIDHVTGLMNGGEKVPAKSLSEAVRIAGEMR